VRLFYLRRNILEATLRLPTASPRDSLTILNTHLVAYAQDSTRYRQIQHLYDHMQRLDRAGRCWIGGGDLNTLPPATDHLQDFDDSVCDEDFVMDDYTREQGWLDPLYGRFNEAIPTRRYARNPARYYSHTVNKNGFWNRRLDYLFTNGQWRPGSGTVVQTTEFGGAPSMQRSDHAPVVGEYRLQPACKKAPASRKSVP
jgi:endonuclease/exonuclease/phosphatase family metal-dependent hydrolase